MLAQDYSNTGSAVYSAVAPQQTRAIHQIPFQCWPNVFDADPALIHWPNADVMLGYRLWGWANIIPTKTSYALITNIIVNIYFFLPLFKYATIWPCDIKRYIWLVHKDCFSEMSTLSHRRRHSSRKLGHTHYCNKLNRLLPSWPNELVSAKL